MGLFGFFGKKGSQKANEAAPAPTVKDSPRQQAPLSAGRTDGATAPAERSKQVERNAARANATAKKIDAIESEMSSEFSPSNLGDSLPSPQVQRQDGLAADKTRPVKAQPQVPVSFEATLPSIGMSTEFLLGVEGKTIPIEIVGSQTSQVIEEAAILFADEQSEIVEQMLSSAIAEDSPDHATKEVWWMLFDLYQITGKQQQFENLSIDYASKFETSPPSWVNHTQPGLASGSVTRGATPTVPFAGKLDGSIIKSLERAQKLAENSRALRLEFARVSDVDPVGCGLLLRLLKKLQNSEHDLILAGAAELTGKIRAILKVGRRDETEAPWLLLLEILRALNSEKEFEEVSIDYCITFEVSPPAFVAPKSNVTAARDEVRTYTSSSGGFVMPPVIEGRTEQLMSAIAAYAGSNDPAMLDCAGLNRVDFSAAGQLLSCLAPLAGSGKTIELNNVNHLVAALFNVIGLNDIARITPRKL